MHLCNYFRFEKLNPGQVFTATGIWFASNWLVTVGVKPSSSPQGETNRRKRPTMWCIHAKKRNKKEIKKNHSIYVCQFLTAAQKVLLISISNFVSGMKERCLIASIRRNQSNSSNPGDIFSDWINICRNSHLVHTLQWNIEWERWPRFVVKPSTIPDYVIIHVGFR